MCQKKYTREEKIQAVERYLYSPSTAKQVASELHMPGKYPDVQIYQWTKEYRTLGREKAFQNETGLTEKEKISLIRRYYLEEYTRQELCQQADIEEKTFRRWLKQYGPQIEQEIECSQKKDCPASDSSKETAVKNKNETVKAVSLNTGSDFETAGASSQSVSKTASNSAGVICETEAGAAKKVFETGQRPVQNIFETGQTAQRNKEAGLLNLSGSNLNNILHQNPQQSWIRKREHPILKRSVRRAAYASKTGAPPGTAPSMSPYNWNREGLSMDNSKTTSEKKRKRRAYTDQDKHKVLILYGAEIPRLEIAKETGVDKNTVYRWCREYDERHSQDYEIVGPLSQRGTKRPKKPVQSRFTGLEGCQDEGRQLKELQSEIELQKEQIQEKDKEIEHLKKLLASKDENEAYLRKDYQKQIDQLYKEYEAVLKENGDLKIVLKEEKKTLPRLLRRAFPSQRHVPET